MEHQNPLVAGVISGATPGLPGDAFSAVSIDNPNVLLWALKPAEEGMASGVIVRLWNLSDSPQSAVLELQPRGIASASETTHIETDLALQAVTPAGLAAAFAPQQLRTYRLFPQGEGPAIPATSRWGLLSMSVLLLAAAGGILGRGRVTPRGERTATTPRPSSVRC